MATKRGRMTYLESLLLLKSPDPLIIWSCLHDELKSLYLYYYNTYDHETWQGGDIPWRAPTHKVTWSLNHVALQGDVAC